MGRTRIEWCDHTINPVKGLCPIDCKNQDRSYCYARRMYQRFKWDPKVRCDLAAFDILRRGKPGDKIFVGSTMELFGPWVEPDLIPSVLQSVVAPYPQRTFIFLTKLPQELQKHNPWPENCWVGCSIPKDEGTPLLHMRAVQARVKFISFEPLLVRIPPDMDQSFRAAGIGWVIIGQQTPIRRHMIPEEWVRDIERAADKAGIPVFLKNNLRPLLGDNLRQEFPRT
jgi:protein gp37